MYYNRLVSLLPVLHSFVDVPFCLNVVDSLVGFILSFSLELEIVSIPEVAAVDVLEFVVVGSGSVTGS